MKNLLLVRNIKSGLKSLQLHFMRSFLTTLGVVFGVGSVIAMLAVGEGASIQAMDQIKALGSNNIIITSVKPVSDSEKGQQRSSFMSIYGITDEDRERIMTSIPDVVRTVPIRTMQQTASLAEKTQELRVVGTTADWFGIIKRPVLCGRVFNEDDTSGDHAVCILTEYGARKMLANSKIIGQNIKVANFPYKVIGIVKNSASGGDSSIQAPDKKTDIYIPIDTMINRGGKTIVQSTAGSRSIEQIDLHQLIVEINSIDNVEKSAAAIKAIFSKYHKKQDYEISVPLSLLQQAEATKRTFNIVLGSIAGISLIVGGIGIMNIMLASVTERTKEIGIRRAIGAKKRQITTQFLIETVVLSGLGGIIGVVVGIFIPYLITTFSSMPTDVTPGSVILSFGISITIGIVFGIYPAVRAANLDPITALHHD
ncbi:MAG: ABC transporter permease [Kiritimatiellae bacterium]|jgi:putative ABC transport system permease protein|nr:ABC transporter permease [Kiritimatiellia bacterium]